ncbi:MAG: NAD-dependent epimerase/dehydratase family protein [Nitrospirae bacterium]|nr:NAD-dependent epimerase/dehydratase family protein [Nitrospirota bacterium]
MTRSTERELRNAQDVVAADLDHICSDLREVFAAMAGRNVLISGGAGFLGYYLVQSLLAWNRSTAAPERIRVAVYDNYLRGIPDWLTALQGQDSLSLARHDISEPLPAETADFQYIVHAASVASPTYYRKFPIQTMDANVNGLRNLLEYAVRQQGTGRPVEGFLFFSSSEIYGDPSAANIPTPETYHGNVSCTGPRACYDESKRYGETLCVNFAQQHGIPVKSARPFNNYGPGLKITDRRVLPDFARDILENRDIVMLSDGSPTRTFCYVADAITGYYRTLVKGRSGEAYNIGVEEPEISIADIAEKTAAIARTLFGYTGKVVRRTSNDAVYLTDNPNRRCPVLRKARNELGYSPAIALDEGLKRSLLWYRDNQCAEEA